MKIHKLGVIMAIFVALIMFQVALARAQTPIPPSIYTVSAVPAMAEDQNAASAKSSAIKQAQSDAVQILLKRLVAADQFESLEKIPANAASKWIEAIEIKNERSTATRYTADVTFIFRQNAVESWLQQQSVGFTSFSSNVFLIIPVYDRGDTAVLLTDENLWYAAWKKIVTKKAFGLVPVAVPMQAGAVVLTDIDPVVNVEKLQQIAAQNGAVQVIIARAAIDVKNSPSGALTTVRIKAQNYGAAVASSLTELNVESMPNASLSDAFDLAAQKLLEQMESEWKNKSISNLGPVKTVDAMAAIRSLNDWVMLETRLRGIPEIRKLSLRAITKDVAQITMDVEDSGENITDIFAKYGFMLTPGNQIWTLRAM